MSRSRVRVCLQDGLKLDFNRLAREGFIEFGANIGPRGIVWNHSYWGQVANGLITADMTDPYDAWLRVQIANSIQQILLVSRSRHFGGRQWFFVCPATHRLATVLWKPPGATRFCSRQTWGRQVAYQTQFLSPTDRIWLAKAKINNLLCTAGGFDREEWDFPPKPKWMRWRTYQRSEEHYDRLEAKLDHVLYLAVQRLARVSKKP